LNNSKEQRPNQGPHHCNHDRLRVKLWRFIECDGRERWVFAVVALVLAVVVAFRFIG